ncbi:uncharacterized protein LOC586728 [Strongylocentrotus purpuratus]|uniref:EF-hand domain-containing protein n=1 Tax=Strongylocentrotus purpuratus TaxID=7668 RepID=A0A7M7PJP8_STRPU|nr:uncharacterized protein LOC115918231 isoform X1 [Strongylocentrotus purpuratus]XP_030852251.1 uncharacterized protein LOC115918231 isoform X1 [Strongylocentrotus purpuratus]XP_800407.2 uncharacterized protein LOC586728 [Strongylocentrotus purpuratus]|eukprot:XP_011663524.1 PREDICTED: uncharacterized protein LOC586728 [Strongylocentrotus purpuratus]
MMKVFLLTFACMMCTISMAWGCVSGAGPSWEISQPGRPRPGGRPGPGRKQGKSVVSALARIARPVLVGPGLVGPGGPEGPVGPSLPRIPVEVAKYFAGLVSKESAFASIDLDGNGLVCIQEWTLGGGAVTEFKYMLIRLDANGDKLISLAELQPFSLPGLPSAPTKRTIVNIPEILPREPRLHDPKINRHRGHRGRFEPRIEPRK